MSGYGTLQQSGGVWEWCADWWDEDYYRNSPVMNPRGPQSGLYRVTRGGSWGFSVGTNFRGARRDQSSPLVRYVDVGFRLARNMF